MTEGTVPAPSGPVYVPDEIILYGVDLNDAKGAAHIDVGSKVARLQLKLEAPAGVTASTVLTYGYAFEGHCYRLDSNRIFIVIGPNAEAAQGCGFDGGGYQMWRITATTQILEISTGFADARSLILDAQLPGKRSPSSYAITLKMAHRNGRLSNE